MKKINLLCLLFMFSTAIFSQGTSADYNIATSTKNDNSITGMWIPGKSIDKKIEGSLYLFPNWRGSYKVIAKNGDSHEIFNLNYNIKTQKLESFTSKDSIFQYDLNNLDYIVNNYNNDKYKTIFDGELNGLFFEVFNSGKIKLFKKSNIIVEEGVMNPLTQEMISKNKYTQKVSYYFWLNDEYVKTKLSKGRVLKVLSDKKDLIKEFASKNNLSYSSDEDISKILNHYILL